MLISWEEKPNFIPHPACNSPPRRVHLPALKDLQHEPLLQVEKNFQLFKIWAWNQMELGGSEWMLEVLQAPDTKANSSKSN